MSKKNESGLLKTVIQDLQKHGYEVTSEYKLPKGTIDILAQKKGFLFAIEAKNRPLETFDIIASSTIPASLRVHLDLKPKNILSAITSGAMITQEAKDLGEISGVIVAQPWELVNFMELVLKDSEKEKMARKKK